MFLVSRLSWGFLCAAVSCLVIGGASYGDRSILDNNAYRSGRNFGIVCIPLEWVFDWGGNTFTMYDSGGGCSSLNRVRTK